MKLLPAWLDHLDKMEWEAQQVRLIEGLLAGNVFDWGAKEVAALIEAGEFGFQEALNSLQRMYPF